jgi:ABC-type transport system involved in multi-copper enzyme maturation permease subunit
MIRARGMVYNAVLGKELVTRMRGWRSAVILTAYMAILGIIAIAFLVQNSGPSLGQSSQVGIQLFQALAVFQLFLILFVIPASTAGAISGERQRQTWELLLVTRLSSLAIAWGKLCAGLAFGLLLVLASLPLFSLVFLFGGVAPEDVIHTYIVFLATILFLGVTSLFVSVLTGRLAVSMIVSNIVALFLSIGLGLLTLYLASQSQYGSQGGPVRVFFKGGIGVPVYAYGGGGPPGPPNPTMTPLAQLDPLVALVSALPGSPLSGRLNTVNHAFGLPLKLPVWGAYTVLALLLSLLLFLATAWLIRSGPLWLRREAV